MADVVDLEVERDERKLRDIEAWAKANITPHALDVASERYTVNRLEEQRVACAAIMSRLQERA